MYSLKYTLTSGGEKYLVTAWETVAGELHEITAITGAITIPLAVFRL